MRYYAGDVVPIKQTNPRTQAVSSTTAYEYPCNPESTDNYSALAKNIVNAGEVWGATINTSNPDGFCSSAQIQQYTFTPLEQQVQQDVLNIVSGIQTNSQITPQEVALIDSSPLPILPFLQVISLSDNPGLETVLVGPLAKTIAYSIVAQLVNETAGIVAQGVNSAKITLKDGTNTAGPTISSSKLLLKHLNLIAFSAENEYLKNYKKTMAIYGDFLSMYRTYKAMVQKTLSRDQLTASYNFQQTVAQGY